MCQAIIKGVNGYGEMIHQSMCCNYPLHNRGISTQRCLCPPYVKLQQSGFSSCEEGNILLCLGNENKHGDLTNLTNQKAFLSEPISIYMGNFNDTIDINITNITTTTNTKIRDKFLIDTISLYCGHNYDRGPMKPPYCK